MSELVRLKNYKDKHGKDEHYVVEQPLAWNKAKVVIKQASEAKAKYKRDALIAFNEWAIKHNFMDGLFDEMIIDEKYFKDGLNAFDEYKRQLKLF